MAVVKLIKIDKLGRRSPPKTIAEDTVVGVQSSHTTTSVLGVVRCRVQGTDIVDLHLGDFEARKLVGFLAAALGYTLTPNQ